jgi:anti-anti-sigma regulatory factor
VISVHGTLQGNSLRDFVSIAGSAAETGMNIVVNLSPATFLGIDALGELIRLHSQLLPFQHLYLAGLRPHQVRVLQGAKLHESFKMVSSVEDAVNRGVRAQQRGFTNSAARINVSADSPGVQVKLVMLYDICRKLAVAESSGSADFRVPDGYRRWISFGLWAETAGLY